MHMGYITHFSNSVEGETFFFYDESVEKLMYIMIKKLATELLQEDFKHVTFSCNSVQYISENNNPVYWDGKRENDLDMMLSDMHSGTDGADGWFDYNIQSVPDKFFVNTVYWNESYHDIGYSLASEVFVAKSEKEVKEKTVKGLSDNFKEYIKNWPNNLEDKVMFLNSLLKSKDNADRAGLDLKYTIEIGYTHDLVEESCDKGE